MADTIENAANTPDMDQPWQALGLSAAEYRRVTDLLGRRPTDSELAMYSVMWSEHCSYKSSKVHLRRFQELDDHIGHNRLLAGIGENAGVIDIGQGYAVTFKLESHNHPSFVDPYQGAATGVGGIVRDILAMGARPAGVMGSLWLGPLTADDTTRVLPGAVAGIAAYGNGLGLPSIGSETVFDASYLDNPLVNALCVGVLRHDDLQQGRASGAGNKVILFGSATGADGVGGASVLASGTFDETGSDDAAASGDRPSVPAGDPVAGRHLVECTLELVAAGVISGIGDLGAAGLSCATAELASAGEVGMQVDLDRVPLRDQTLTPEEILMSETQERMMAVVEPGHLDRFLQICARWDVPATAIGEVRTDGRLVINWHDETVVDVDPQTVAADSPVYDRPVARPDWQSDLTADRPDGLPRPESGDALATTLLELAGSANLCDKSWITAHYDSPAATDRQPAYPHADGMLPIDDDSGLGVALATGGNARFTYLDPYTGAQNALAEAYRSVAVRGARPIAVSDCLNFGAPEDPAVMWQFSQTIAGFVDGCKRLGLPVTGGNVSLYNQTGERPILPTPVAGVLGVIDDGARRVPAGSGSSGDLIMVLGDTRDEFAGSAWTSVVHDHLGGTPPPVDLAHEERLAQVLIDAAQQGLVSGSRNLSAGGLGQGLVETCLQDGQGASVCVPEGIDRFTFLFSETTGRVLVVVPPDHESAFRQLCAAGQVPVHSIGTVGGDALQLEGQFSLGLDRLRRAWQAPIPDALGPGDPAGADSGGTQ